VTPGERIPPLRTRIRIATAVVAVFAALPASAQAAFKFGSRLAPDVQPQPRQPCIPDHPLRTCTWIMNEAFGRPNGGEKAPRRGTIIRLRVIADSAGSFRLQIARARATGPGEYVGKVIRNGPVVNYAGQPDPDDPYRVEVFTMRVPVRAGDRLAIRARSTSALRCGGGGDATILFNPPLPVGGAFRAHTDEHDCWLLVEAVVRPPS
jgi:hypothetical protein